MLPLLRGGAGLDQPDLWLERALGKRGRERTGQAPGPRQIASVQCHLRGPLSASSAQGSLGFRRDHSLESRLGFLEMILFLSTSAARNCMAGNKGESGNRFRPSSSVVMAASAWLRSSSIVASSRTARAPWERPLGRQRSQELFGLGGTLEPDQGQCALKSGLGP